MSPKAVPFQFSIFYGRFGRAKINEQPEARTGREEFYPRGTFRRESVAAPIRDTDGWAVTWCRRICTGPKLAAREPLLADTWTL